MDWVGLAGLAFSGCGARDEEGKKKKPRNKEPLDERRQFFPFCLKPSPTDRPETWKSVMQGKAEWKGGGRVERMRLTKGEDVQSSR